MSMLSLVPLDFNMADKAGKLFATVREKADGKGHYARIMTRVLCAHNDREILRAGHLMNHIIVIVHMCSLEKIQHYQDKGVFKYYISKFSMIWDPPPPSVSIVRSSLDPPPNLLT